MNEIAIDDIKLKIGELVIENIMLQKRLFQLQSELEQIKEQLQQQENKKATTETKW